MPGMSAKRLLNTNHSETPPAMTSGATTTASTNDCSDGVAVDSRGGGDAVRNSKQSAANSSDTFQTKEPPVQSGMPLLSSKEAEPNVTNLNTWNDYQAQPQAPSGVGLEPVEQNFRCTYLRNKATIKSTIQGKVYNFLERPTGWKCFIYHFSV